MQNQQPAGAPNSTGGQFVPTQHAEPDVTLPSNEKSIFTEADNEPDIFADSPTTDGYSRNVPANDFLDSPEDPIILSPYPAVGLPAKRPTAGGLPTSPAAADLQQREASQNIVFAAAKKYASHLLNARTVSISSDDKGYLHVDEVRDHANESMFMNNDSRSSVASSLQFEIRANVPYGVPLPAHHVLGDLKSASIDASALLRGEIKIVGFGKPAPF
ncbi:hypothetical protein IV500_05225 [Paeniglutamicibacter antarcticus]|uniref:Uncharacterized protein n=1 Tax=Arthrobacter terrae TaxID=2935737 RepID=A0A931G3M2_9MICC|nr:hypothetical protein [Arthrobacter terrae]MBG0738821.1 hypothetical protein [Arthrobacter terrae]